jgi:hypothetical protein
MKQQSKLSQEQQQIETQLTQQPAGREFASPEELLRFDAAQTAVPPEIAQRLKKSIGNLPPPPESWWKRFFGGTRI